MPQSLETVRARLIDALPRLRRFARTITRHVHDADDLVQLATERALQRYAQWDGESKFESWMFGIMRNAWIDEARSRKRQSQVLAPEEAGEHVGDRGLEPQEAAWSVQAALEQLPEEQRLVIGLVLVEGLAYKEAAHVLDIPIGTVMSRLARGREALQGLLKAKHP
ncbi:MAG: RNA polymerase sigma factor [Steroidobacteraceae bacterium]